MRCFRARRLMSRRAAQGLSMHQEQMLQEHLVTCGACSRLTDELERAWKALEFHPILEPSADFIPRFKARLREEEPASREKPVWKPVLSWRWMAMAACILLAVVLISRHETGQQDSSSPPDRAAVSVADQSIPDEQFLQDLEEILQQSGTDVLSAYDVWPGIAQDSGNRESPKAGPAEGINKKKEKPS